MAAQRKPKASHPLDALAKDTMRAIALMLWKDRKRNPDMAVMLDEKDMQGFEDCVKFLGVTPEVQIFRPEGTPAQEAVPAAHGRRAVPARAATPPKPFVVVTVLGRDRKGVTGPIRAVENNQEDYDQQQEAEKIKRIRELAPQIAGRILQQARSGEFSTSDLEDAANALVTLARA
jgi:hypothetical protein